MGYDKDVFSDEASLLDRAHDANCAVRVLAIKVHSEKAKLDAFQPGSTEGTQAAQRAGILSIALKLAVIERDNLLKQLAEMLSPIALDDHLELSDGEKEGSSMRVQSSSS
jgi:hypothetical protein